MKLEEFFREVSAQSKVVKLEEGRYVKKCYGSGVSLKWYFILSIFKSYPFVGDPRERMGREIEFFTYNWNGIKVPKIVDFDYDEVCLLREFVDGRVPATLDDVSKVGKALRYIHDSGFVMGDTKAENFLINDYVYVIDAEQSIRTDSKEYRGWDLAVFLLFLSYKYLYDLKDFERLTKSFLLAYSPDKSELLSINNLKNVTLLSLFPPMHLATIRKTIGELL